MKEQVEVKRRRLRELEKDLRDNPGTDFGRNAAAYLLAEDVKRAVGVNRYHKKVCEK